jgi:hypothetical protein
MLLLDTSSMLYLTRFNLKHNTKVLEMIQPMGEFGDPPMG